MAGILAGRPSLGDNGAMVHRMRSFGLLRGPAVVAGTATVSALGWYLGLAADGMAGGGHGSVLPLLLFLGWTADGSVERAYAGPPLPLEFAHVGAILYGVYAAILLSAFQMSKL